MMHHNDVVLTVSTEKNSVREYNFKKETTKKSCEVILPYDTEYKINVKNSNKKRIMLDVSIDGGCITSSGLVIPANSNLSLERFVDVAKKFKFVKSNNEQVSDPTSSENGKIIVKVHFESVQAQVDVSELERRIKNLEWEKEQEKFKWPSYPKYPTGSGIFHDSPVWIGGGHHYGYTSATLGTCDSNPTYSASLMSCTSAPSIGSIVRDCSVGDNLSAGATVEGGDSKQTFTTTAWAGTSETFEFEFKLFGKKDNFDEEEYKKFLELKTKYGS